MTTARHAYRGTMKALKELGLKKGGHIETVDDVANRLKQHENIHPPLPSSDNSSEFTQIERAILEIDPYKICNWELHDRPESELGDIEELSKDIAENGQVQPCIVRPYMKHPDFDFELIVGERRWRAAKIRNIKLKVIVENINDQKAAIYQITENGNRKDLSDYAKGLNYSSLIEREIITSKELEKILGKNKIEVSRLLSFNSIPKEIWDAIEDTTKISARTASEIRAIINKGDKYYSAIIELAPKIRTGKLGANSLLREVENLVSEKSKETLNSKIEIRTSSGRHLFSWRKDSNGNISISFPKDIRNSIDKKSLELMITHEIENQLTRIDKQNSTKKATEDESFHVETA